MCKSTLNLDKEMVKEFILKLKMLLLSNGLKGKM